MATYGGEHMRIRLIQKNINDLDYRRHLVAASENPPDLVCFGELATSGCLYRGGEVAPFEPILTELSQCSFATFIGIPRRREGRTYNSYAFVDGENNQFYDKINLFEPMNEHEVYTAGSAPGVFDTRFGRFGAAICYDLRFPDLFARLAQAGVEKIIVPAAFPRVRISDWKELIVARALETGCFVIGVNAVGDDGLNEFGGCSMVCDKKGRILAQASETEAEVVEVSI